MATKKPTLQDHVLEALELEARLIIAATKKEMHTLFGAWQEKMEDTKVQKEYMRQTAGVDPKTVEEELKGFLNGGMLQAA